MIDIRQGARTVFGDAYRFKLMVEDGQIDPVLIRERIEMQYYEVIYCRHDLLSDAYARHDFGLPAILVEAIRKYYKPRAARYGLYLYVPARLRDAG